MVNNLSQSIELTIDKNLNLGLTVKSNIKDLVNYSKYNCTKKHRHTSLNHYFENFDFSENSLNEAQSGLRSNQLYDFLKVKKTQCKFNLIRLFKPGELLNSVMSS
ncbi:MAG TPA: hypothetical protein P5556_08285 [Candidatus Gastranaerophilales bacterium]|nr:hypothetical protein [Candidatus Gastranaerophilales bacterium]